MPANIPRREPPSSPPPPNRARPPILTRLRTRARRLRERSTTRLILFSGWTWVAAGSLVGFEMLDLLFGTFVLAPELLPLAILALACVWYFRTRLRRAWSRARARLRLARVNRRAG